jgi:hypothetical protein
MAKYRKKPVVIDAWWVHPNDGLTRQLPPKWLLEPMIAGVQKGTPTVGAVTVRDDENGLDIHTLEGVMHAQVGDWIIRGVKGELYPCKPDIFAATYEPVLDGE